MSRSTTVAAVTRPARHTATAWLWLGAGAALAVGVLTVLAGVRLLFGLPDVWWAWVLAATVPLSAGVAAAFAPALAPAAVWALREAVVVSMLALLVFVVYVIVVIGLGRPVGPDERGLLTMSMVAAGVVALLAAPVRSQIEEIASRLTAQAQEAPEAVLRAFGSRMTRSLPMDEVLLIMAEQLSANFSASSVEVYTGVGGEFSLVASVPHRGGRALSLNPSERQLIGRARSGGTRWAETWLPMLVEAGGSLRVAPVTHRSELLGLIVVRTDPETELSEAQELVLVELARQTGLALNNARLDSALQHSLDELQRRNNELRESRLRIVSAANDARRSIERNLHDGAQQHLVALAVKIGLIEQLLASGDTDSSRSLLAELRKDVQVTVGEVRELAHGIYPPLLRDRGLAEALRAAASRSPLAVNLVAEGLSRHGQDLEAAIYFCCVEALQNAGKYAGPEARVSITVSESEARIAFEVRDDGAGFELAGRGPAGHGFVNMLDRLGALGGSLQVRSAPGEGTTVSGALPLLPETAP